MAQPSRTFHMDDFDRPAAYWRRRAQRARKEGDVRRAAALLRHAARLEPESVESCLPYADALRELGCYEASNREALSALARNPGNIALHALVCQNDLLMGRYQAAEDAYALCAAVARADEGAMEVWSELSYPLWAALGDGAPPKRRARLDGLLSIAERRMARGNLDGAREALLRAGKPPFGRVQPRRDALIALYYTCRGIGPAAALYAKRCFQLAPSQPRLAATAATVLHRFGSQNDAMLALLTAVANCQCAEEESMACSVADQLGLLPIAQKMLEKIARGAPNRLTVRYNLCVCLLKQGKAREAYSHIGLCRELDPDDMPSDALFQRVDGWLEEGLSPEQVAQQARELPFYGGMRADDLSVALRPVADALEDGLDGFASRLQADQKLYRRFLDMLAVPESGCEKLLIAVCERLPTPFQERLLRDALIANPYDGESKRYTLNKLSEMGAKPPYLAWFGGRFFSLDPTRPPEPGAGLLQRLFFARVRQAGYLSGYAEGLAPFALALLYRMSWPQRMKIARDRTGVWSLALALHYCDLRGLPAPASERITLEPGQYGALADAVSALAALAPKEEWKWN